MKGYKHIIMTDSSTKYSIVRLLFLPILSISFLFQSCSKELANSNITTGDIEFIIGIINKGNTDSIGSQIVISADNQSTITKVAMSKPNAGNDYVSQFSAGDEIGIYGIVTSSGNTPINNVKLTYDGRKWIGDAIKWPVDQTEMNFFAYYPYDANYDLRNQLFSVNTDQSKWEDFQKSDLMMATNFNVDRGTVVNLDFTHMMSMVQVNITANISKAKNPDKDMDIRLLNVYKGFYPIKGNEFEVLDTLAKTTSIKMYRVEQEQSSAFNTTFTYRALVPIQNLNNNSARLSLSQGGKSYLQKIDRSIALARANVSYLNVPALGFWAASWISPGTFQMGTAYTPNNSFNYDVAETPQHWVRLTKGFYMGRYEVTVAEYAEYLNAVNAQVGNNGDILVPYNGENIQVSTKYDIRSFLSKDNGNWNVLGGNENLPMQCVTYAGVVAYSRWVGGELPTEAQWEYACRAGTNSIWSFGDDMNQVDSYAITGASAKLVGERLPNPWGLYDMHGNVREMCLSSDEYVYPSSAMTESTALVDPTDPKFEKSTMIMSRGGGVNVVRSNSTSIDVTVRSFVKGETRSAFRGGGSSYSKDLVLKGIGFRIIKYK